MTDSKHTPSFHESESTTLDEEHRGLNHEIQVPSDYELDPANPYNWSAKYKWSLTVMISAMSLSVNLAILMTAPATPEILREFDCKDSLYGTLLVSIWELGEVFGPLILAPLSEIYGRLPVYHTTTILFVVLSVIAGFSTNVQMLVAFRFLLGTNVASVVLNPCIVGDMFRPEQRGKALSVMGMVPYVAPCLGPLIGGGVSDALGWRWTFWLIAIITGSLEVMLLFMLRETYQATILRKRFKTLSQEHQSHHAQLGDLKSGASQMSRFGKSITKPVVMMCTIPALPLLSTCGALGMSITYVMITSLTGVFRTTYNFSESTVGLSYMGLGLGMIAGIVVGGLLLDKIYRGCGNNAGPEDRLPVAAFSYLAIPLGLLVFGWTARPHVHWIAPIVTTFFVGVGFTAVTLASWAYLIDAFGMYAASATAAVTVVRNAASATLPLAGPPLTAKLGLGLGFTVIALIGFAFSPVPFILIRCGKRLRRASGLSSHQV